MINGLWNIVCRQVEFTSSQLLCEHPPHYPSSSLLPSLHLVEPEEPEKCELPNCKECFFDEDGKQQCADCDDDYEKDDESQQCNSTLCVCVRV